MYFERRHRIIVWALSLSVAGAICLLVLLQGAYITRSTYTIPLSRTTNNALALALLVALAIPAAAEYNNIRWLRRWTPMYPAC